MVAIVTEYNLTVFIADEKSIFQHISNEIRYISVAVYTMLCMNVWTPYAMEHRHVKCPFILRSIMWPVNWCMLSITHYLVLLVITCCNMHNYLFKIFLFCQQHLDYSDYLYPTYTGIHPTTQSLPYAIYLEQNIHVINKRKLKCILHSIHVTSTIG